MLTTIEQYPSDDVINNESPVGDLCQARQGIRNFLVSNKIRRDGTYQATSVKAE